jgi:hypothetical protein
MGLNNHILTRARGSNAFSQQDRIAMGAISQLAYPAGNGDPSAVAAGTPGLGYASIPTAAFANAGSGSGATVAALMGVEANPAIAAAGTGGTNGAVTLTGTTGTGTKFQITGTIAGGVLTAITGVTVAGSYSVMPTTLAAEPVTGGSLTGATVNLSAVMGVVGYSLGGASNHQYAQGASVALTGGTPSVAAVPGAVTVNSVAGQGSSVVVNNLSLPGAFCLAFGDVGQPGDVYSTNRNRSGFTVNIVPGLASQVLAAGAIDIIFFH